MERKLKIITLLFVAVPALFLSSCQVEENIIGNETKFSSYNVRDIYKSEIDSNFKIVEKLQKITPQKNSISAKNIPLNNLGLIIQTDHAKYIENKNYNSYTFPVVQEENENIKNIFFSLNESGDYDAYLVEYPFTKLELHAFGKESKLGEAKITPIKLDLKSLTGKESIVHICFYNYILVDTGDLVGAGNERYAWVLQTSSCSNYLTYDYEEHTPTNYSNGAQATYTTYNYGGGATTPVVYDDPVQIMIDAVKSALNVSGQESRFLDIHDDVATDLYDVLARNQFSEEVITFGKQILVQKMLYPDLQFDINGSFNSPMNIDRLSIDNATPDGAKFNKVYDELTKSPEFKKLFVDLFETNSRFNVKFEIAEHVYKDNDPSKEEVNATTTQDPVTKHITIRISKQVLISNNTKIEIAKTILHECIHAYLFVKANDPSAGTDFVTVFKNKYPTKNEQHYFMYDKMIPTMQKVLGEIRDLVTTPEGRALVEQRTMHPTLMPLTSTPWNWTDYYKYVSINGFEETDCFKEDFPVDTDQWKLYIKYVEYGHDDLRP